MTAPFGIEMGSAISMLEVLEEIGGGKFFVRAPRPHPQFATYLVQASPAFGVVWVKGLGAEIENDGYGHGARAAADRVAAQLSTKYGQGRSHDWLDSSALWNEPKDWVMSLMQGERGYFHVWQKPDQPGIPDDLETIFVGVSATSSSSANVVLEYSSSNLAAAEAELDNTLADLL